MAGQPIRVINALSTQSNSIEFNSPIHVMAMYTMSHIASHRTRRLLFPIVLHRQPSHTDRSPHRKFKNKNKNWWKKLKKKAAKKENGYKHKPIGLAKRNIRHFIGLKCFRDGYAIGVGCLYAMRPDRQCPCFGSAPHLSVRAVPVMYSDSRSVCAAY